MKKYFNIIVIILSLLIANIATAKEIYLPVISEEIKVFAEEANQNKSNARYEAYQSAKPVVSKESQEAIELLVSEGINQQQNQKTNVQQLLKKTINNKEWRSAQANHLKIFNQKLGFDEASVDDDTVSGHRLYLFVSSAMPIKNMREYAKELAKYPNSQMILRGFIGGARKMQPTMSYIKSIITKDASCMSINCKNYNTKINIDPVLFNRYNVKKVPTLVYVDELSGANYCSEGNTDIVKANGVHRFTGLAPLKYMIRELAEATNIATLEDMI